MKFLDPSSNLITVDLGAAPLDPSLTAPAVARGEGLEFDPFYRRWFADVSRWVRALGVPDAEREDVTQEVFLVVRKRICGFDGRRPAAWLYRITANVTGDYRRRSWFRNLLSRSPESALDSHAGSADPEQDLEHRQLRRTLDLLLKRLGDKHRVPLVLFEIEGYSGEEIAAILGIPVDTVWTRLHHARRRFQGLLAASPELGDVIVRRGRR